MRYVIALLAVVVSGCAGPLAPSPVRDPQAAQPETLPVVVASPPPPQATTPAIVVQGAIATCAPQTSWEAEQVAEVIGKWVAAATSITSEHYGWVVYSIATEPATSHAIFGELRRSQPRFVPYDLRYALPAGAFRFASKALFLDALLAATPSTIEVRLAGGELARGCLPAAAVKGRIEGVW